jgi:hypothetical protein
MSSFTPEQWAEINRRLDLLEADIRELETRIGIHESAKVGQSHSPRVPAGPPRLVVVSASV